MLSDEQRAEVRRSVGREGVRALARRLGVSRAAVRDATLDLTADDRRRSARIRWGLVLTATLGLGTVAMVLAARRVPPASATAPSATTKSAETREAKNIYRALDEGRVPPREEVVAQLAAADATTRLAAVRAFARLEPGDPTPLSARLTDEDERVRRAAIQALGASRDARALAPLASALAQAPTPSERSMALDAIDSAFTSADASRAIAAGLGDSIVAVRAHAFEVLKRRLGGKDLGVTEDQVQREPETVRQKIDGELSKKGDRP